MGGVSSPPDRTAPPAGPAACPGLTASAGELRTGPSASGRTEAGGTPRSSGLPALHKPKSAQGEGGREGVPPPAPASSSPSEAGHAGQPGPRSELQGPGVQNESEPRSRSPRSAAPTLPSGNPRSAPDPPLPPPSLSLLAGPGGCAAVPGTGGGRSAARRC